jgi:putative peptidoglycan lipid II flippase
MYSQLAFKSRFLNVVASATGVTVLVQLLAFVRQLLIAAYFGIGRDFDAYVVVNTLAALVVFNVAGIFDSIAVPHLVRTRESGGRKQALSFAQAIFRVSTLLAIGLSLLFLVLVPILVPIFATGFSPDERGRVVRLAWYFLPWTLVCVPYYAAAARYKMEWRFNRVFLAEIVVIMVSMASVWLFQRDIALLPVAYASGYGAGLILLAADLDLWRHRSGVPSGSVRGVLRNFAEMFFANQTGSLVAMVDRHIQSFLEAGGISAVSYSNQIVATLSTLLTFREIYMVPLTEKSDRDGRLERLISGLSLLAVPSAGFVLCFGSEIVTILLQRGRFDAAAAALTTQVLQIGAFSIVTGTLYLPLLRMFQIIDRIHFTQILYLSSAVEYALFGYVFVVGLGLGVRGVAIMQVGTSGLSTIIAAGLLSRCGVRPNWRRVLGHLLFALSASVTAFVVVTIAVSGLQNAWARLIGGGSTYGLIILVFYFFARSQLRAIVLGATPSWKHFL